MIFDTKYPAIKKQSIPRDKIKWQEIKRNTENKNNLEIEIVKILNTYIEITRIKATSQFSSVAQSCPTLWDPMDCSTPGFPCPSPFPRVCSNSCPLSGWCHPTISSSATPFSSCLQSFPGSGSFPVSQFFTSVAKYWSFNFSMNPSNAYSGLISFRIDWLDHLAVKGTLKSLFQHHSSKASI